MDFSVCYYEFHWDLMVYKSLKLYDFYHSSLEHCNLIIFRFSLFFRTVSVLLKLNYYHFVH